MLCICFLVVYSLEKMTFFLFLLVTQLVRSQMYSECKPVTYNTYKKISGVYYDIYSGSECPGTGDCMYLDEDTIVQTTFTTLSSAATLELSFKYALDSYDPADSTTVQYNCGNGWVVVGTYSTSNSNNLQTYTIKQDMTTDCNFNNQIRVRFNQVNDNKSGWFQWNNLCIKGSTLIPTANPTKKSD